MRPETVQHAQRCETAQNGRGALFLGRRKRPAGSGRASRAAEAVLCRRHVAKLCSTLYWLFVAAVAVLMFPLAVTIWLLTLPFDRRRVLLHHFTCFWASIYTWCNPVWSVRVHGREKIRPGVSYVMVANHLSLVDIFVLFRLFRHFKWVSKIENFKLPFIGWNMHLNRYIPLRRGDRDSVVQMLDMCRSTLEQGNSIMMFPEGTRSKTGELKAFKPGAFELAKSCGRPVLPIVIRGSFEALPKKGFTIRPARIEVHVLDPIEDSEVETLDVDALMNATRERILAFQRQSS